MRGSRRTGPVRVLEADLRSGDGIASLPSRYHGARVLGRLDGTPIGYARLPNSPEGFDGAALARHFVEQLEPRFWEEEVRRRLGTAPRLSERPAVSVVVCARSSPRDLHACLAAVAAQTVAPLEVTVVDGAPGGGPAFEVARDHRVQYVVAPQPGLSSARNAGLRASRAAVIAFVDEAARPAPGWLAAIADAFASPGIDVVTGHVMATELETHAQHLFQDLYGSIGNGLQPAVYSRRGRSLTFEPELYGNGSNMAFRRDALEAIGGFDEILDLGKLSSGGGELDAFQRLIEANGTILYRPDAYVRHVEATRTMRDLSRRSFERGLARGAFLAAAWSRARGGGRVEVALWYLRLLFGSALPQTVGALFRRNEQPLRLSLLELGGFLAGPVLYAVARRRRRKMDRLHAA